MWYLRVTWLHKDSDYPVILYSELDNEGWEKRKVEMFADGRIGFAPPGDEKLGTTLSAEPIPPIHEIELDPQFEPSWITNDEFDKAWAKPLVGDSQPRKST